MQLLDVTDFVEFLERNESVSGVQRVIAELTPRLPQLTPVVLDRARGQFIPLTSTERENIQRGQGATGILTRIRTAAPITIDTDTILVFLGALWISDALMLAARHAQAQGAKLVVLLYDLTPVLDANHTAAVNRLFERYLSIAGQLASRVPAISQSSRNDFADYCAARNWETPPGAATQLPPGITPQSTHTQSTNTNPWPRPYALFVGTIEGRKNHLLAFNAWQELLADPHYSNTLPDLVCVGRLGWNANEFLREYVTTNGLNGKVSVLDSGVSDEQLAAFYQHAQFTIYPSKYEGWGLPVSESLAFGKVPITANTSSLPEAGGDLAVYFESDNQESLTTAIKDLINNPREVTLPNTITWDSVADVITEEINQAQSAQPRSVMPPEIELGHEYILGSPGSAPDAAYADKYLDHLTREGLTPLLKQAPKPEDLQIVDTALIGEFGSPQTWGYELRPGKVATFTITRPQFGDLTVHFATRSMPGRATISAAGPGGPVHQDVYLGSVVSFPLGAGNKGESAQVTFHVTDASDSIEGFLGLRSFVVLESNDSQAEILIHKSAAQALRQELDFMTNTRSWKVTEPLRKWKGRGK